MKNLSFKERFLLIACGLALFVAVAYIFVIMPMNKKIDARKVELEDRRAKDLEYKLVRESNNKLREEIKLIRSDISKIETEVLADIDVDVIEAYIMSVFEKHNSNYLKEISSTDIACDDIIMPNGKAANEKLVLKRFTVEVSTTDGYTIPEVNGDPLWYSAGSYDEDLIAEAIEKMGDYDHENKEYEGFVLACQEISEKCPTSMKVHDMTVEDTHYGYSILRCEIDVYSADFGLNRVTDPENDPNQKKIEWFGNTGVDCKGGMIGMPLINVNTESDWFGTAIPTEDLKDFVERPYASYFSNAILTQVAKAGMPLYEDLATKASTAAKEFPADFSEIEFATLPEVGEDVVDEATETPDEVVEP